MTERAKKILQLLGTKDKGMKLGELKLLGVQMPHNIDILLDEIADMIVHGLIQKDAKHLLSLTEKGKAMAYAPL